MTSSTTSTVGIVGVGIMGAALLRNLRAAGFEVVGYDISPQAMQALEAQGGHAATSARAVAEDADRIIVSLPTQAAVRDAVLGDRGIAAATGRGQVVLECSTMPLELKQEVHDALAAAGMTALDCPVSGTGAQARERDLVIFGSGDRAAFEACGDLLRAVSKSQKYLGAFGAGTRMKFIANHLVHCHTVAAAEALVLAEKAGIDGAVALDALSTSAGASVMLNVRGPLMVRRAYDQRSAQVKTYMKDMEIISRFALGLNCPVPMFSAGLQLFATALAQGRHEQEPAAIHAVLSMMANLKDTTSHA
ncbi:MAG: 6-phosphogluconate dehydrogenase NAD-binding protein [Ramlibacter sp.]|nr:6-phosphogluconate dehydrogenase NAD-binding protein [Ramlibacter sp.]